MDASQIAALTDTDLQAKVSAFVSLMDPALKINMFLFVMLTTECAKRSMIECGAHEAHDESEGRRADWADLCCELAAWTVS